MKTILYIEAKPHVRDNFVKLISGAAGFFRILTATTIFELFDLIERIKVDIVITGRDITAQEILDLDQCLRIQPETKLIVMAQRKSKLAGMLKAFEYKLQFEVPVDLNLLLDTVLDEFGMQCGGHLRDINIGSFLQLVELEAKTCVLNVFSRNKTGCLYCDTGELIEAEIDTLRGKEAALAILSMDRPLISIDYTPFVKQKNITVSLMHLLLESSRKNDESQTKRPENRRYTRFSCEIPVEFSHNSWSHKGVIGNISLSGAYLITQEAFEDGQTITISLYSLSLKRESHISGTIMRKTADGVGIEFATLSINQMAILRTVINEVSGSQTIPRPRSTFHEPAVKEIR